LTATIDSHHPKRPSKAAAQRFSVHLLALRGALLLRPRILFDTQFPRGAQGASEYILARFRQRMWVAPILPHPPGMGRKTSGNSWTNSAAVPAQASSCRSLFSDASVAKILPPTRKSAAPMCEPSSAPSRLKASRRKSDALIVVPFSGRTILWTPCLRVTRSSSRAAPPSSPAIQRRLPRHGWWKTRCPVRLLEASRKRRGRLAAWSRKEPAGACQQKVEARDTHQDQSVANAAAGLHVVPGAAQ